MTDSEKLYKQLFSSFSGGKLEAYDWLKNGFIAINSNTGDLYYLADDKKAFHLLNETGLLQCFQSEDFVDIPIKEYLRGMTYEDIIKPIDWTAETKPQSIRLVWRVDTDERIDYANFNLEDKDEPYLNNSTAFLPAINILRLSLKNFRIQLTYSWKLN